MRERERDYHKHLLKLHRLVFNCNRGKKEIDPSNIPSLHNYYTIPGFHGYKTAEVAQ